MSAEGLVCSAPTRVVPHLYVPRFVARRTAHWDRLMAVDGSHRRLVEPSVGDFTREEIDQDVLPLDFLPVGSIIRIVHWGFEKQKAAVPIGTARLCALRLDVTQCATHHVQVFQTL